MGILNDGEPQVGEVWTLPEVKDCGRLVKAKIVIDNTTCVVSHFVSIHPDGSLMPKGNDGSIYTQTLSQFVRNRVKFNLEPEFKPGDILTDKNAHTHVFLYISDEYVRRHDPEGVKIYDLDGYVRMYGPLMHVRGTSDEQLPFNVLETLRNT
jgi:hypothetical protein